MAFAPDVLTNQIQTGTLVPGAFTAPIAHGMSEGGVAKAPTSILPTNGTPIAVSIVTSTTVVFVNNGAAPTNATFDVKLGPGEQADGSLPSPAYWGGIDIVGATGVPTRMTVVYRPQGGGDAQTWAQVMAFVVAAGDRALRIIVDEDVPYFGQTIVPAGYWDMNGATLAADGDQDDHLWLQIGARLRNVAVLDALDIVMNDTGPSILFDFNPDGLQVYDPMVTYSLEDLIQFGGLSYQSAINGNTGNQPDISPLAWVRGGLSNPQSLIMTNGGNIENQSFGQAAIVVPDAPGPFQLGLILGTDGAVVYRRNNAGTPMVQLGVNAFMIWRLQGMFPDQPPVDLVNGTPTSAFGIQHMGLPGPYFSFVVAGYAGAIYNLPFTTMGGTGPTATRPIAFGGGPLAAGTVYFDTDLAAGAGRLITWNGTIWTYADGTPV
jgi:hypothetical protein